jgi:prephenate dehydrogenase
MMIDIMATNTKNVLAALRSVRMVIEEYEALLEAEAMGALADGFAEGAQRYRELTG